MLKLCCECMHYRKLIFEHPCKVCINKKTSPYWEPKDNLYWQRICALAEKQRAKGMSKYGVGLENNTANATERVRHIQEELIDALMYLTWLEEKLKEGEADDQD